MTPRFRLRYTEAARQDLIQLFDFLLQRAETVEDFDDAQEVINLLRMELESRLTRSPLIYRKAAQSPFVRELVIPFRSTGYVVLFEVEQGATVSILAVRHQREDDYY